jgi:tRNA A-37 threonylcarbamoyl transferase component Bud32
MFPKIIAKPQSDQQLLKTGTVTARILGGIHAANFVHGDIKTSNIIYSPRIREN